MDPKKLTGQVEPKQIEDWKKQYPAGIFALQDSKGIGYFKNPDRHEINAVLGKMEADRPLEMFEDLAKTTWLGGDQQLLDVDSRFFGVIQQLKKKMDGDSVKLVNL